LIHLEPLYFKYYPFDGEDIVVSVNPESVVEPTVHGQVAGNLIFLATLSTVIYVYAVVLRVISLDGKDTVEPPPPEPVLSVPLTQFVPLNFKT